MAEAFLFCGPLGHLLIEMLPSVHRRYRIIFHYIIRITSKMLFLNFSKQELAVFELEVYVAYSHAEISFPVVCPLCLCVHRYAALFYQKAYH